MISLGGRFDINEVLFVYEPSNKRLWGSDRYITTEVIWSTEQ